MKKLDLSEERKQFDSAGRIAALKSYGYFVLGTLALIKGIDYVHVSGANRGASLLTEGLEKGVNNCKDD